jgi:site-specific DNA recombinase
MQQKIDASYDEIERLEYEIKKCKKKLASLKKGVQGTENVKKILKNFPRLYEEMDCFEKREMYRYFIKRIDLFPEEQSDGKIIKSITFNFPVFYGDEEEETTLVERFTSGDKPDEEIEFTIDCSDMKPTVAEAKATYAQIRAYVMEHNGLKVPSLYIAQVKRKYGIELGKAYNKPEEPKNHVPKCPKEKELAIIDALKAYRMLDEGTEYKEDAVE